jgi:hypothetical protein
MVRIGLVLLVLAVIVAPGANVASARTKERRLMADFSLQALHDEIEADSLGIGYKNGDGTWKEDSVIVDLINQANYQIDRGEIAVADIQYIITYDAYNDLAIDEQEWYGLCTRGELWRVNADMKMQLTGRTLASDGVAGTGDDSDSWWSLANREAMAGGLLALIEIDGSRAEVLWGEGKVVTISEVAHAANL